MVPRSLKNWFTLHFAVDYIFGVPLLLLPKFVEPYLGLQGSPLILLRIVGAALLGIGGISLLAKEGSKETYKNILLMKVIWSLSAILGLVLSLLEGFSWQLGGVTLIFLIFSIVWMYYLKKLRY